MLVLDENIVLNEKTIEGMSYFIYTNGLDLGAVKIILQFGYFILKYINNTNKVEIIFDINNDNGNIHSV